MSYLKREISFQRLTTTRVLKPGYSKDQVALRELKRDMNKNFATRPLAFARRAAALSIFAGATTCAVSAQQVDSQDHVAQNDAAPLVAFSTQPLNLATTAAVNYSSSASSTDVDTSGADSLDLSSIPSSELQPPPRRRYGRPRYNDSSHNPDGSNKYSFIAGVGLTLPVGNTYKYLNTDYAFQVGAGRNFNKNFSLLVQFDYDHFGFNAQTIYNQTVLYGAQGFGLDGKSHVWSFTLDPVYNFYASEGLGAYVTGGVGFFHKTANFTVQSTGYCQDPYYGIIYQCTSNQTIDKYTSNAPGFDGGFGLTYKPSRFAGEKFYVEAKYVYMINSQRYGLTVANANSAAGATYAAGNNYYPRIATGPATSRLKPVFASKSLCETAQAHPSGWALHFHSQGSAVQESLLTQLGDVRCAA